LGSGARHLGQVMLDAGESQFQLVNALREILGLCHVPYWFRTVAVSMRPVPRGAVLHPQFTCDRSCESNVCLYGRFRLR